MFEFGNINADIKHDVNTEKGKLFVEVFHILHTVDLKNCLEKCIIEKLKQ